MPVVKEISNAAGYGAVVLAIWYAYSMASNFYHFYHPETCKFGDDPSLCVLPLVESDQRYILDVHLTKELPIKGKLGKPILSLGSDSDDGNRKGFMLGTDSFATEVQVPVKKFRLHKNRTTLFAVAIASIMAARPAGRGSGPRPRTESEKGNLFDPDRASSGADHKKENGAARPVLHWNRNITIHLVNDATVYPKHGIPGDVRPFYTLTDDGRYLPALYAEQLSILHKNSLPLDKLNPKVNKSLNLNITVSPISLGKWRAFAQLERTVEGTKKQWGFGDQEIDQIKQLFCFTNHILLGATIMVSFLHTLFSFLAMKNDIMYWRKRESMLGVSASQVIFECVASYVVFLYLLDSDKGNKIVNFLCLCECVIATWKVIRISRMREKADKATEKKEADAENRTSEYDWLAIKYLGSALMPFVIGYCIYSLLYEHHKSLFSWIITSLASAVYAVGFILMTPQLFINYKLKSVAHLPWRTITYKAFNTFVDDLFSLVIDMPLLHRLACFRDDIVFFIFLYQWWLYGSDKRRSYELEDDIDDSDENQRNRHETVSDKKTQKNRRNGDGEHTGKDSTNNKKKKQQKNTGLRRRR
eukprot:CAMPEP_0114536806 /NCGR_PEP_ID=MMETSP0109-20121206/29214_1 /TAXON_ID=29199 /ORGANISM="Chlorarachnion reptans, Strain CCCM449" /LENGTH=586 /DNA_ID=CAMNT_0001720599 /DNA_START=30 /DNA_END=1791 /DNA_ORIENTATION=-